MTASSVDARTKPVQRGPWGQNWGLEVDRVARTGWVGAWEIPRRTRTPGPHCAPPSPEAGVRFAPAQGEPTAAGAGGAGRRRARRDVKAGPICRAPLTGCTETGAGQEAFLGGTSRPVWKFWRELTLRAFQGRSPSAESYGLGVGAIDFRPWPATPPRGLPRPPPTRNLGPR